jgi:Multicopper oxidase
VSAGRSGGQPDPFAAALPGFSVVHIHGAVTNAASDGWTENLAVPGQQALDTYPNDQRAALLWYHDHVMGVTRFSVYAGLAGLWIVRDDRERELDLPEGPPYELPLLLTDRNFDTGADASLTGELLHKTDPEVMECFSPFTAVNGAVWPVVEVEPTTCRFRMLNGSKRPHLPARAHPRRRTRPRADQSDRHRGWASARARTTAGPRTRPGISRTGRPSCRLLGPSAGHRAHVVEHRHGALRRDLRRSRHGGQSQSRRVVALPGGAADPCRRWPPP